MTSRSDLDQIGFDAGAFADFLACRGIRLNGSIVTTKPPPIQGHGWLRFLAAAPFLLESEAAGALAGVDIHEDGWWKDAGAEREHSRWLRLIGRCRAAGELSAHAAKDEWGNDAFAISHADLSAWCESKGFIYPLPTPANILPVTDAGLSAELTQARATAKTQAAELDRLRAELAKLKAAPAPAVDPDMPPKSRNVAAKIIAGLAWSGWKVGAHGGRIKGIGDVLNDLRAAGCDVDEGKLREWLRIGADQFTPPAET